MNKPKVLVVAYSCDPMGQSEKSIGWNYIKEIAQNFSLTVLTRQKNKKSIVEYLKGQEDPILLNINWVFFDMPDYILRSKKFLGVQLYFKLWLISSFRKYETRFNNENFDLVNHLNFGMVWMSTPYFKIKSKFVWGPIGGGDLVPFTFLKDEKISSIIREFYYAILVFYSRSISRNIRNSKIQSNKVVFRTEQVRKKFLSNCDKIDSSICCETGFEMANIKPIELKYDRLNAIAISRMDYWKGTIYAIKGFHDFITNGGEGKLTVIGKGNAYNRCKKYIDKHSLNSKVLLLGHVSYEQYLERLQESNVLIYPSFRDGGSFTILESMANGLPIICSNLSGPAEMVGNDGFVLDAKNPKDLIYGISSQLTGIMRSPDIAISKGLNLRRRAEQYYTWEARGNELKNIFNEVLGI